MLIGELCNREVVVVRREATINDAAQLMRRHHVGSLLVVDPMAGGQRAPAGIVTDRDLVIEIVATGLDPKAITVDDIMSTPLSTVRDDSDVLSTIGLMRERGVRRLPVVGAGGALVGVVSIDDLIGIMADELGELVRITLREQAREARERR